MKLEMRSVALMQGRSGARQSEGFLLSRPPAGSGADLARSGAEPALFLSRLRWGSWFSEIMEDDQYCPWSGFLMLLS